MTRVCENQLCNAGDEGEPKEIVPKQYANGKWSKQRVRHGHD